MEDITQTVQTVPVASEEDIWGEDTNSVPKVSEDITNSQNSLTASIKSKLYSPAEEAFHTSKSNKPIELSYKSIYEIASDDGLTVREWVQKDPEYAVKVAEAVYAQWQQFLTSAAINGTVTLTDDDGEEHTVALNKNQTRMIEKQLDTSKQQLDLVNSIYITCYKAGDKRKDVLQNSMYLRALNGDSKLAIYLHDRVDGKPSETKTADMDYDNAYNIYMIIHTLFDKQLQVLNSGNGTKLICCSRRAGKCWSPDTLLRKYDGTLVMAKNVVVGDIMMGAHNEPQKVLSTTTGKDQMFRIRSKQIGCRIDFTCNSVHVLTVRFAADLSKTRSAYKNVYKKGEVYDIPLNEFLQLPSYIQNRFNLMRQCIDYPEKQHIIDPYILGLWLGDGDKAHPRIAVGVNEPEIMSGITDYCNRNNFEVNVRYQNHSAGECCEVSIKSGKVLPEEMRRLNIEGNKHIPQEYLIDSVENRLQLLAGLIDSDGCLDKRGNLSFSNTDKVLVDTVIELCDSLGFRTTVNKQVKKYWSEAHSAEQTVEVFNVFIKGKRSEIPCRCPRKQAKDSTQSLDYGFYITPVGEGDYAGFTLDGDGRLLLSDYTVTHNTHMLVAILLIECLRRPRTKCMYIGETAELSESLIDKAANDIIDACQLKDKRGRRFNWKKIDNGSEIMVRGLSNTKDPDQIRGQAAKVIVIDEFFHLKSELLEYMQREVLEPMQMDFADDYKFICAGTPPQVKGTYGEYVWKNWEVDHFQWTWRDNPHPVNIEQRKEYVEKLLRDKGLDWSSSFARREYNGEWAYDEDLLLYPEFHVYDPREAIPTFKIDRVLFGIDYGVGDNDTLIGIAWSDEEKRGYQFWEDKFNRLDITDRTISQLEYLCGQVKLAWQTALDFFPNMSPKEANKRILWDADDNDQHVTDYMNINIRLEYKDEMDNVQELKLNIQNAHKTDRTVMQDKIADILRTGDLLLIKNGKCAQECQSTILKRGPNGEVYHEVDMKAYHPDLLPAMRYALWNAIGVYN